MARIVLTLFLLLSIPFLPIQPGYAAPPDVAKAVGSGGYQYLADKARNEGAVRVIVRLAAPLRALSGRWNADDIDQLERTYAAQDRVSAALRGRNARQIYAFEFSPHMSMSVDQPALDALLALPDVLSVEEDVPVPAVLDVSVPKIGATITRTAGFTGIGQTVAVLDTGVDKNHPFLSGAVVSEACYSTNGSQIVSLCPGAVTESTATGSALPYAGACPAGECDHGTHVSGIAAGRSGVSGSPGPGVAPGASLIAVQIFTRFNNASTCNPYPAPCVMTYTSDQLKGLSRVYALKDVYSIASVNMSIGGSPYSSNCDTDSRKPIIDSLRASGIATVIATGNSSSTTGISAPSCISSAVSVGATDDNDLVASYSNRASFMSFWAPGSSINSSVPPSSYESWNGTSMATPHAAGAWAVLKQQRPSGSVDELFASLHDNGVFIMDSSSGIVKPRIHVGAAAGSCYSTGLLANPGFESGTSGWTSYSSLGYENIYNDPLTAYSGSWYAWLGGDVSLTDYIEQTISIPSSSQRVLLRFMLDIDTGESVPVSKDTLSVELRNPSTGALITTLKTYSNQNATTGWEPSASFDLSAWKGQSVRLRFASSNNSSNVTHFRIDDIRLVEFCRTCTFSLSSASQSLNSDPQGGSVNVTASGPCSWAATTTASWITITSGTGGSGSSSVAYTVTANPSTSQRVGTITIAGQTYTVTQRGYVSTTVATSPAGKQVTVDGSNYTAPSTFNWGDGGSHTLDLPSPQSGGAGTQYVFSSWSDSGAKSHSIVVPAVPTTYTANLTTLYRLTTAVSPSGSGSVNPDCSGGCWYDSGASPNLTAQANSGYTFSLWSGDCAGTSPATSVTMTSPKSCTANFVQPGVIQLSASAYSVTEGTATVQITATRTGGSDGAVGISYETADGNALAGSDYTSASGALSWANGDSAAKTITVLIADDTLDENDETFIVTLSGPTGGVSLGSPSSAVVTIVDNDTRPNQPLVSGASPVFTTTPTWTWVSGGGGNGTFRYRLDNSDLVSGATETGAFSFTPAGPLAYGAHTLYVQERDASGNWSLSGHAEVIIIVQTGVPDLIGYQGYLTDSNGVPVDGQVDITFALYRVDNSQVWTETKTGVVVAKGVYSVILNLGTLPFDEQYFLGVAVAGGPEMTPRQPLTSVGYAIRSAVADGFAADAITSDMISEGAVTLEKFSNDCSEGQILRRTAAGWACGQTP